MVRFLREAVNPVEPGGQPGVGMQLHRGAGVGAAEKLLIGAGRTQVHYTNMDDERRGHGTAAELLP